VTKASELAELDDDELQNRLASARRELLNLRFQVATGQLDNTERLGEVRRDIARALTILRARDLSEELVELEPLVLTPARRLPIDTSGGVDEDAEVDADEDGTVADEDGTGADEIATGADETDELEGSEEPEEADAASDLDAGDEEDAE
jgi:large subunit ribosomal protein L29